VVSSADVLPSNEAVVPPGYRPVRLGATDVTVTHRADGAIVVRSVGELGDYPEKLTDRLEHWAVVAPDRTFIARRRRDGGWRRLSFSETLQSVRAIAAALIDRDLSPDRPVAILSSNDIEHALLALACLHAGIPYAPISPAYSTASTEFGKLRHVIGLLTPGLVFAADGADFGPAIEAVVPPETEIVLTDGDLPGRRATLFADLLAHAAAPAVDAAHRRVNLDTVAKFLFTSGSTGLPKGVINTQRMIVSNQEMLRTSLAFLRDEPPVLVDWLPWNHTFGGNHNFGLTLYNGGSLYIDDGRPTPAGIAETVRNLREIAPTVLFNVPKGFEVLLPYLRDDAALRRTLFSRLRMTFYAAAGLSQDVWDEFDRIAIGETGHKIVMLAGLGATETAPFALVCHPEYARSGHVGLPAPGIDLKLVPVDGKMEARLKGPNITPGYWRQPDLTEKAFDEEGFYRLGDALTFVDPADPQKGFLFDGRINEDFKLATGTWVSVGPLRMRLLARLAPYAFDVVLTGLNRGFVGALIFPDVDACRALRPKTTSQAPIAEVLSDAHVTAQFRDRLAALAGENSASSTRVARAILLAEPPSIDAGEITDKGSINQRAVLSRRANIVEQLYREPPASNVIVAD
jgi:feruloyl-CoA synthase